MGKDSSLPWVIHYYRDTDNPKDATLSLEKVIAAGLTDPAPARAFLQNCPDIPAAALFGTITTVSAYPPLSFPGGTPMWSVMHKPQKKKEVDMSGIYEARDKHEKLLYRLFCVLDSQAMNHGLEGPALVMLSGTIKKVGEKVPQSVYKEVRQQADRYFSMSPRPVMLPAL